MPDEPRVPYRPAAYAVPAPIDEKGFTARNTSGVSEPELVQLNCALGRLMAAGLSEHEAKLAIDAAVREWLEPKDAGGADLERLLAWGKR